MNEPQRLRLSREVRIGEMIAALGAISAIATGYIELRLRPIEQQIVQSERAHAWSMTQQAEFKKELRDDMLRLEAKLDRLIEQLNHKR